MGSSSLLGNTATDPGAVDAASAAGGRFLYVQTGGNGIIDEFGVAANGALTKIGAVTVPGGFGLPARGSWPPENRDAGLPRTPVGGPGRAALSCR